MVAYNFNRRFETPILSGRKRQTIRDARPRHAADGETIQLYVGMRTKACRLLGLAVCVSVLPVTIDRQELSVTIRDRVIDDRADLEAFAEADGFSGIDDMLAFFEDFRRPPKWSGVLITWRDFVAADNSDNGVAHVDD